MKLGIICEGGKQGADYQTYPLLIKKICNNIIIEIVPLGDKTQLIDQCGIITKVLLEHSMCDKVLILWDFMPRWDKPVCRKVDSDEIKNNLKKEGIPDKGYSIVHAFQRS